MFMMGNHGKFFLIGIPNCGKTTLGRRAAGTLQLPFYDTDVMACERLGTGNPVDQILAHFNGSFIRAQWKAVEELVELDSDAIIATGAEVALQPVCATRLRHTGTVIHIRRNPEAILAEIAKDGNQLILREETSEKEVVMQEEAVKLYSEELSQYESLADLTMENDGSEDDGFDKLIALIKPMLHLP